MSVAPFRLWRRAPAWRLCFVAAIAFSGLAATFPPAVPDSWNRAVRDRAGALLPGLLPPDADAGPAGGARYVSAPDGRPLDYGSLLTPPLGVGRSGTVPFGGRQLPLPAGTWQELLLARAGGPLAVQVGVLDRAEANRLTGLLVATMPGALSGAAGTMALPEFCLLPDALLRQITTEPPTAAGIARECWTLAVADLASPANRKDEALQRGLQRLHELNVAVPDHLLALRYFRSDAAGWAIVTLFLPDRRATVPVGGRAMADWLRRYTAALHSGFDRALPPGDLPPAAARDP